MVPVLEVLARHEKLVLLGAPGSAKSTLTSFVALSLAQAGLGEKDALARLGTWWTLGPLPPGRIVLRQFAGSPCFPKDAERGRTSHIWDFIAAELMPAAI